MGQRNVLDGFRLSRLGVHDAFCLGLLHYNIRNGKCNESTVS